MNIRDYCKFHNKLGSDQEVANSEIGPDCFWRGSSIYQSGQFGNASYVRSAGYIESSDYITLDDYGNVFIYSFWLAPLGWSYTDGIASDSLYHYALNLYIDTDNRLVASLSPLGFFFLIRVGGNSSAVYFTTGITSGDGEWHRMLVVYDRAGIGDGEDRRRLYFDGSLVGSSVLVPAESSSTDWLLRIGATNGFGTPPAGGQNFDGLIDNPKIFHAAHITEEIIAKALENQLIEGFVFGRPFFNRFNRINKYDN